jgi:transcriptional regulator with XRE-family HTH domain
MGEEFAETLGARLQRARRAAGTTQDMLALRAHMSRANLSNIENGRQTPSLDKVEQLAQVLKVDPAWLAWGRPLPDSLGPPAVSAEECVALSEVLSSAIAMLEAWADRVRAQMQRGS